MPSPSADPRILISMATYNERDNLEPMVRALGEVLDTSRDRVLVIDDSSPDGTGELADRLAEELAWVDVLHRAEKQGLGPAYVAGFGRALADGAELVLELDCDFSHDPADVPRLIAAAEAGEGDLVLGVRVRDLTGGFKCFRREVLENVDLGALSARGYAFQIETTYRVIRAGFGVLEVPIEFVDRRVGESKMTGAIVAEAMWKVPQLRWRALTGRL